VGVAVVGVAGSTATSASSDRPAAGAAATESTALKLGPRQRRALRRKLQRMRRVSSLEPRALKRFPGTFGGIWKDPGGELVLAFTSNPGAMTNALRTSFAKARRLPAARLDSIEVDDSLASLRDLLSDMVADRDANQFAVPYDLHIDLQANNVVVTFDESLDVMQFNFRRNQMQAFYGARSEDIVFAQGPLSEEEAVCNSVYNCNDLRAGLRTQTPGGNCTTAFVVSRPAGMPASSDAILSAAHCGGSDVGASRRHGLNLSVYGHVFSDVHEGSVDAEVHSISEPGFGTALPVRLNSDSIIGKTKDVPVVAVSKYNNLLVGALVCRTGITSGVHCGKVTEKNYAPAAVPNSSSFIRTDVCAEGGDSGGPWYQPFSYKPAFSQTAVHVAMATGVHSGSFKDLNCDDTGDKAYFSHITNVKKALGVKVLTPIGAL
jgi:hypothetical protein